MPADLATQRLGQAGSSSGPEPIPERKTLSGTVVPVRLGVALAAVALASAAALFVVIVADADLWLGVLLAVAALSLSGWSAYLSIFGVIRYGLFTEGCGADEVADELHRSRIAWLAGVLSQVTLLVALALTVVLIVRAIV